MKLNKALLIICAICFSMSTFAQEDNTPAIRDLQQKGWKIGLRAGINVGGTMPVPLPSEMKSINTFNPGLNFGIQVDFDKMWTSQWGTEFSLRFEQKGMKADVTVENYHTKFKEGEDMVECNYTGIQSTDFSANYITIPLNARYRFNNRWSVLAGPYFSYVLSKRFGGDASNGYERQLRPDPITGAMVPTGPKTIVDPENPVSYDFSDDMRRFNWGVEVGVDFQAFKHFLVFAHLDWGLNDAFKDSFSETISFPMYPVYGQIGFGYNF